MNAARVVFLRDGVSGTRTKEIAEQAGVREGLLFHYFDSKEALFEVAVLEPLREMVDGHIRFWEAALLAGSDQAESNVREAIGAVLKTMVEVVPSLGMMLYSNEEAGRQFYADHFYPLINRSQQLASEFVFRLTGQSAENVLANAVYGMSLQIATDAWLRSIPLDLDATADALTQLFLYGVSGRSGQEDPDGRSQEGEE